MRVGSCVGECDSRVNAPLNFYTVEQACGGGAIRWHSTVCTDMSAVVTCVDSGGVYTELSILRSEEFRQTIPILKLLSWIGRSIAIKCTQSSFGTRVFGKRHIDGFLKLKSRFFGGGRVT